MISSSEITTVVQGPIEPFVTQRCLESLRRFLPESKIILSTWHGEDYASLDKLYDELVLSEDPGAPHTYHVKNSQYSDRRNNLNRQITSTINGLNTVATDFSIKMRSDTLLVGNSFLSSNLKQKKRNRFTIFEGKIFITNLFTLDPYTKNSDGVEMPHHPSDIFQLGLTSDLVKLWSVPLLDDSDATYYEDVSCDICNKMKFAHRYTSEQHIWLNCLKANKINFSKPDVYSDTSRKIKRETIRLIRNNFVVQPYDQVDIEIDKFDQIYESVRGCLIGTEANGINPKDISIVVQGAVNANYTLRCLKSIRACLPDSKIILSTWQGSDLSCLKTLYDEVILSDDPGQIVWWKKKNEGKANIYSNINRQIVSTFAGLRKVESKYALKFRTDLFLDNFGFINHFNRYNNYDDKYKCVQDRVLIWNLYTRNPNIKIKYPYHFSDIVMFGLTYDLQEIWDIPLCPKDDYVKWGNSISTRYMPEQYIWLNYLRKHQDIDAPQYYSHEKDIYSESENYMLNNVVLLSQSQFGLKGISKKLKKYNPLTCYTHADWLALYRYQSFGERTLGLMWLKFKELGVHRARHYVWRKAVKAVTCLIPNKKLRHQVRRLY
jgi:hypothetical protein